MKTLAILLTFLVIFSYGCTPEELPQYEPNNLEIVVPDDGDIRDFHDLDINEFDDPDLLDIKERK